MTEILISLSLYRNSKGVALHNYDAITYYYLSVSLLGAGQQPLAKFHQGVVVGRVRGMLLRNQ